jgi:acyl carrier protein phosphodiesterase
MNFLAHAYLSFDQPEILVGNLISDFVKGKKKLQYSEDVQHGIALHRAIDTFTDYHQATQIAKQFFRLDYRLYSGAFMDIVYDHFLANDENEFSDKDKLMQFSAHTYKQLDKFQGVFPENFSMLFPYMKRYNWLYNYSTLTGIKNSFDGLVRRSAYMTDASRAFEIFQRHYDELKKCYHDFFPSLKFFANNHLQLLIKK